MIRPPRIEPGPGQESVWDYPRPPRLERTARRIQVFLDTAPIADTGKAWRILETSHPPVYYLPRDDIQRVALVPAPGTSFCEWKGRTCFVSIRVGNRLVERAGWFYPEPTECFEPIRDHVAFYARQLRCLVDGERVRPQPEGFYGGWVTPDVVGPFKGEPGTESW